MLKRLTKNKKGQNTAEYAILISLVVASIVAMQTYAQRALQARVKDASDHLTSTSIGGSNTTQYEPYYQRSEYEVERDSVETERLGNGVVAMEVQDDTLRRQGGFQETTYNQEAFE